MKIFNLVRSEFKKNYSKKKLIIITLILVISTICFVELYTLFNTNLYHTETISEQLVMYKNEYDSLKNNRNKSNLKEYELLYYDEAIKYYEYLIKIEASDFGYQRNLVNEYLLDSIQQNKIIDGMRKDGKEIFVQNCNFLNEHQDFQPAPNYIYKNLCNKNDDDIEELYNSNKKEIKMYEDILIKNKYYLYLEMFNFKDEFTELLKNKKVENWDDFRSINYRQYLSIEHNLDHDIISEYEFINGHDTPHGKAFYEASNQFDNYDNYLKNIKRMEDETIKNKNILLYSTKNNIKHDIAYYYDDIWNLNWNQYITSKTYINNIFHLSVIVLIIVAITGGGIVSKEHSTGTIKNVITTPVRRWKILLSKFIYLILHTYIVWFILLFILILYTGIRFGFSDIISPKLLYKGGKVIEVNYILYLVEEMIIAGIPIIAFLSILLMLSTITLNTAITVGITTIMAVISPIIWILVYTTKFYFIRFVPFLYFDSGFIINKSKEYSFFIKNTNIDLSLGIVVSLICIIIAYFITNIVYIKRDIKN